MKTSREKLNKFADIRKWNKNKLIGWSEAADFAEWYAETKLVELLSEMKKSQTPNPGGGLRPIDYDVNCVRRVINILVNEVYDRSETLIWSKLKEYEGNYPEDYTHENGNYMNVCKVCGSYFMGHKRRIWCKLCLTNSPENPDSSN